ncbi:hypothetical protein [Marinobacter sp. PE14]
MIKPKKGRSNLLLKPSPLPFIPPFGEAVKLLGVPSSLSGAVNHLSRKHQEDLPVSEKTLRKASVSPVTHATAEKIGKFLLGKLPYQTDQDEVDCLHEPWQSVRALNNGYSWHAGVLYPIKKLKVGADYDLTRFLRFIESRCEQELEILGALKEMEGQRTARRDVEITWYEFLTSTTEIAENEIADGLPALVQWCTGESLEDLELLKLNRLFLRLTVDFYYSVVACLDYDLSNPLREQEVADKRLWDVGLFGTLVPTNSAQNFRQPIDILLDEWRTVFATSPGERLSWAEMYQKLPYPFGVPPEKRADFACVEDAIKEVNEIRKSRLYAWRRGEKRPTKEQADVFVRNLVPAGYDDWWACLRFYWANALGRLIESERIRNEQWLSATEVVSVFESYDRYWLRFGAPVTT